VNTALVIAASTLLLATAARGQSRVVELGKPSATLEETFTAIAAVRELDDGRLVVADPTDKTLSLVDLAKGTAVRIGREGRGPGEYAMPAGLIALPDGRTLVYDLLNQRFLVLDRAGTPKETVSFASLNKGMMMMLSPAADQRGRLYFQSMTADVLKGDPDSVPILRSALTGGTLDTAGFFRPRRLGVSASGRSVKMELRMFYPEEAWVVAAGGRIARVTPDPYRVIWYDGARAVAGPAVPYAPIAVTEADKTEAREAMEKGMAIGRSAVAEAKKKGVTFSIPEPDFAPTKPPFLAATSVVAAPNDEVWVERSRAAGDHRPLYDRFDRAGRPAGQIRLPARSRVVGFGRQALYLSRQDEDDLVHLERYRWP
jgi:hypothetical protein